MRKKNEKRRDERVNRMENGLKLFISYFSYCFYTICKCICIYII